MNRGIFKSFAVVAVFLLLTGFGAGTPIYNAQSTLAAPDGKETMENIEKAIVRAGMGLGWQIVPKGPGKMEGVLNIRRHQAVVDIGYDTKSFNINYKSSVNLDYKEPERTIHSNYNGWIQNLEKAIKVQASTL